MARQGAAGELVEILTRESVLLESISRQIRSPPEQLRLPGVTVRRQGIRQLLAEAQEFSHLPPPVFSREDMLDLARR